MKITIPKVRSINKCGFGLAITVIDTCTSEQFLTGVQRYALGCLTQRQTPAFGVGRQPNSDFRHRRNCSHSEAGTTSAAICCLAEKETASVLERFKSLIDRLALPAAFLMIVAAPPSIAAQAALIQLSSEGKLLPPAAVYHCASISEERKCISAISDDTAHLSENPSARILSINGKINVTKKRLLGDAAVSFYIADENTLLDSPKYNKLEPANHQLYIPPHSERAVLIAIYHPRAQKTLTKMVWLLAPAKTGETRDRNP